MSTKSPQSTKRTTKGHFAQGTSGNPSGRPLGSRNQSTVLLEQRLQQHQEALLERTIELALKGDPWALRLCLERLYPVPRERRINLPLPEVRNAQEATTVLSSILNGIGEGQITPGEGAALAEIVETQGRLIDARDKEQHRLELTLQFAEIEAEVQSKGLEPVSTRDPAPAAGEPPLTPLGGVQ